LICEISVADRVNLHSYLHKYWELWSYILVNLRSWDTQADFKPECILVGGNQLGHDYSSGSPFVGSAQWIFFASCLIIKLLGSSRRENDFMHPYKYLCSTFAGSVQRQKSSCLIVNFLALSKGKTKWWIRIIVLAPHFLAH
jgi:hypothetical protein